MRLGGLIRRHCILSYHWLCAYKVSYQEGSTPTDKRVATDVEQVNENGKAVLRNQDLALFLSLSLLLSALFFVILRFELMAHAY